MNTDGNTPTNDGANPSTPRTDRADEVAAKCWNDFFWDSKGMSVRYHIAAALREYAASETQRAEQAEAECERLSGMEQAARVAEAEARAECDKWKLDHARLQMELDASCNAEELRQARAERDELIRAWDKAGAALGRIAEWAATPREDMLANAINALRAERDRLAAQFTSPLRLIAAERLRQQSEEGWTPEHDDTHRNGELAAAAGVYALPASHRLMGPRFIETPTARGLSDPDSYVRATVSVPVQWPWNAEWWKPTDDRRREIIKAAALLVAEYERLHRAAIDAAMKSGKNAATAAGAAGKR